jgi:hypothetical protein
MLRIIESSNMDDDLRTIDAGTGPGYAGNDSQAFKVATSSASQSSGLTSEFTGWNSLHHQACRGPSNIKLDRRIMMLFLPVAAWGDVSVGPGVFPQRAGPVPSHKEPQESD